MTNQGPSTATDVVVQDDLPNGYSYAATAPQASQGSYNTFNGIWTVGTLASGQTETLTLYVTVEPNGDYTNLAEVIEANEEDIDSTPDNGVDTDGDGDVEDDPEDEDDGDGVKVTPIQIIDLELDKSVSNSTPDVGSEIDYTITVVNQGPSIANNVIVTDVLPSGVAYISDNGAYNAATGEWMIGTLSAGETVTLVITAEILPAGDYVNLAEVTNAEEQDVDSTPDNGVDTDNDDNVEDDPEDEDDGDGVIIDPVPIVDLELDKSVSPQTGFVGDIVTFTIVLTNQGPSNATGVVVTDNLPSGFEFVSTAGDYDPITGEWAVGDLSTGQTVILDIEAEIVSGDNYTNLAEVTDVNEEDLDSTPDNGVDTDGDGNVEDDAGDEDDGDGASVDVICIIDGTLLDVRCDDNGTLDESDDLFYFTVNVTAVGTNSPGWVSSGDQVSTGVYGVPFEFGPFLITDGTAYVVVTDQELDGDEEACRYGFEVDAPAPCSLPCEITTTITDVFCDDNGTPSDDSDDVFYFEIEANGAQSSDFYDWTDGALSGTEMYGRQTFGPYPISGGAITIDYVDSNDPDCTASVTINPPATCSEQCDIDVQLVGEPLCDNNGTPTDPSDDTYTFQVFVSGSNLGTGWTTVFGVPTTTGDYGVTTTFGPFNIADGNFTVRFQDVDDVNCFEDLVVIAPPTCSDDCIIDGVVSDITCDGGLTPSNPNDDTFTFTLTVTGENSGATWTVTDGQGGIFTGAYGQTVDFGPYDIVSGDVVLTITDNDDPTCITSVVAVAPTTCSDVCDITATLLSSPVCNDNGTPGDPTDDFFTFTVEVSGSNTGSGWTSDGNITSGNYGDQYTFTYQVSDGDQTITFEDDTTPGCQDQITVIAPADCSDQCSLTLEVVSIGCFNNETPFDPADDQYYVIVFVDGFNTSETWSTNDPSLAGGNYNYGDFIAFGPFPISGGDVTISIFDTDDMSCAASASAQAPPPCPECDINADILDVYCDDNGTPFDATDDQYYFDVLVTGANNGPTWIISYPDGTFGQGGNYGEITQVGPFPIADGDITLRFRDIQDSGCQTDFTTIEAPDSCSDACDLTVTLFEDRCGDNGTPTDPSDDVFFFELLIDVAGNAGTTFTATTPDGTAFNGTYGILEMFGPFPIADGPVVVTIVDDSNPDCNTTYTADPTPTCSDECLITANATNVTCDDNGTATDPSDDTFTFELMVNAENAVGNNGWSATINGQTFSGSYGSDESIGPFQIIDGPVTIVVADAEVPNCSFTFDVDPPATCSDDCSDPIAQIGDVDCTGDTYTTTLEVQAGNAAGDTWAASVSDGQVFTGDYGFIADIGPFNTTDGDLTITITDNANDCLTTLTLNAPSDEDCGELPCNIDVTIDTPSCDDNGTPFEPSDDTYTIDVTIIGLTSWIANDPNNTTGGEGTTTFGPYPIADGGFDLKITDINNADCMSAIFTIDPPATCSDCTIGAVLASDPICNDNGTVTDPSDDTFTFEVTVTGSTSWTASDPNNTTGGMGTTIFGPYLIADGGFSFTFTDGDDVICVTDEITISAPAPCSNGECEINAVLAMDAVCDDNGTPNDPTDDTFTFFLDISGTNGSGSWTANDPNNSTGVYGDNIQFGPYSLATYADTVLDIEIADAADPDCNTSVEVQVPAADACQTPCDVSVDITNVWCDNMGTPFDPSDDEFYFTVLVDGTGLTGTGWTADDPANIQGVYGIPTEFGPYLVIDGAVTFSIVSNNNNDNCIVGIFVQPPTADECDAQCSIEATASNIVCYDNGTPFDPSDDTFTFDVTVIGNNTSVGWFSGVVLGFYNIPVGFGPFDIADGPVTLEIVDAADVDCTTTITVTPPAACSGDCDIIAAINDGPFCDPNGTDFDDSDDVFFAEIIVTGQGIGTSWTATNSNGNDLVGDYNVPTQVGPFPISGGDVEVIFTDSANPTCQDTLVIPATDPCSGDCILTADVTDITCDDNGTPFDPSDDTYTFNVTVTAQGTSDIAWVANDPNNTSGNYDETVSFGPYPITDLTIIITDVDDDNCAVEFNVEGPTFDYECPEDTDEGVYTEDEVQIVPGELTITDAQLAQMDSLCWWNDTFEFGDRYYDTLRFKTPSDMDNQTTFTFVLYSDMVVDSLIDGTGAIFKGELDSLDMCSNILAGAEVPYTMSMGDIGNPITDAEALGIPATMTAVQRLTVRLDPEMDYTLLTTTWLPAITGNYRWVLFSQSYDLLLALTEEMEPLTVATTSVVHDLMCTDTDVIFNDEQSTAYTGMVDVSNVCGFDDVIISDAILSQGDCEATVIERTFIVSNTAGDEDSCTQTITVRKLTLEDVVRPQRSAMFDCGETYTVDANGNPHPSVTGYPYVVSAFGTHDLDDTYCNLTASYEDTTDEICAASKEIMRRWTVMDVCELDTAVIFTQLIKVGDFTGPVVECPTSNHYCPIIEEDIMQFSTDPFDCTATFEVPMPDVTDNCSDWTVLTEIVDIQGNVQESFEEGDPRMVFQLGLGDYFVRYTVTDECDNVTVQECRIRVADLVEPTAICFASQNLSLGGFGLARLYPQQINNGSYDNCAVDSVQVRRLYTHDPGSCDPVTPYYLDWGPYVEFNCCDVDQYIMVELRVVDQAGNENVSWLEVLVEDNTLPQCYGLDDVTVECIDLPIDFDPYNVDQLEELFGEVFVFDNCAAEAEIIEPMVALDDCGNGTITRRFLAVDVYGNVAMDTFQQIVTIQEESNYEIRFPKDVTADCAYGLLDTVIVNELGCDLLAVTHRDTIMTNANAEECYTVSRTYSVINWCEYDGISNPVVVQRDEDCDGVNGDEDIWVLRRPMASFIDRDNLELNLNPLQGTKSMACDGTTNADGYWRSVNSTGYWQYTQQIQITADTEAPMIIYDALDSLCIDSTQCIATFEMPFRLEKDCVLDTIADLHVYLDVFSDGTIDLDLVEDNQVSGTYPDYLIGTQLVEGEYTLIIETTDFCNNISRDTMDFKVVYCGEGEGFGCSGGLRNYEIRFPMDTQMDCPTALVSDPVEYTQLGCDLLTVTMADTIIDAIGEECYRMERTYHVINWCEYNGEADPIAISRDEDCDGLEGEEEVWVLRRPTEIYIDADRDASNSFPQGGVKGMTCDSLTNPAGYWRMSASTGYWTYKQEIAVYDTMAPSISIMEMDTLCTGETCTALIDIEFAIVDGCVLDTIEHISIYLDEFNDGIIDADLTETGWLTGTYPNYVLSGEFTGGNHRLQVIVEDACGNVSENAVDFEVLDCSVATPDCFSGIVMELMPVGPDTDIDGDGDNDYGAIMIMASTLIEVPITDCSGAITYSINKEGEMPSMDQATLILTCDDSLMTIVEVYAWDSAYNPYAVQPDGSVGGPNYSYCSAEIQIQDGNDLCSGTLGGGLRGVIKTELGERLHDVAVTVAGDGVLDVKTDAEGCFQATAIRKDENLTVIPHMDADHKNGISTQDIITLAQYLKDGSSVNSPYKLIAADVDKNAELSAEDISILRKLILGEIQVFKSNTSWRFIDKAHEFDKQNNPWFEEFPEVINFEGLPDDAIAEFIAVKIGDLNNSAIINNQNQKVMNSGVRYLETENLDLRAGNEYKIMFTAKELYQLQGFQFTLNFDQNGLDFVDIAYHVLGEENFGFHALENGFITTSWNATTALDADAALFTITFRALEDGQLSDYLFMDSAITSAEAYDQVGTLFNLDLNFTESEPKLGDFILYQNKPNPFKDITTIGFKLPQSCGYTITIFDSSGKVLNQMEDQGNAGYNEIQFDRQDIQNIGNLYYRIETELGQSDTKKMIIVN